jgi:excisionase family DNA binding protein
VTVDASPELLEQFLRVLAMAASSRLALSPDEAAAALGVSRDFFDKHVLPELRVVRRGRKVLVSIAELERWLAKNAARTIEAGAPNGRSSIG